MVSPFPGVEPPLDTDYVIVVNRANDQSMHTSEIWPVALNDGQFNLIQVILTP